MGLDIIEVSSERADEIQKSNSIELFDNMISALEKFKERKSKFEHLYKIIDAERDAFVGYMII